MQSAPMEEIIIFAGFVILVNYCFQGGCVPIFRKLGQTWGDSGGYPPPPCLSQISQRRTALLGRCGTDPFRAVSSINNRPDVAHLTCLDIVTQMIFP